MRSYLREAIGAGAVARVEEYDCPHCGERHNAAEALNAEGHDEAPPQPEPGSIMVCEDCGEIGAFVSATELRPITIKDVPAEVRGPVREAMARVKAARASRAS